MKSLDKIYHYSWLVICVAACLSILHLAPSFDGAMNLLPAKNFVLKGYYYSFYFEEYFNSFIQTRLTQQFPAIITMWIGGVRYFTALLPNALYTFGFIFFSYRLIRKIALKESYNYYAIPIFFTIPFFFNIGLRGWGEVISYFFIIISLIYWVKILEDKDSKNTNYLCLGLGIGLAIVTKTVALITLPAFFLTAGFTAIIYKKVNPKFLVSILGILIPILAYEFFKLGLMGIEEYQIWWKNELGAVQSQAGVNKISSGIKKQGYISKITEYLGKIRIHLRITAGHLNIHYILLFIYFLIPGISTLFLIFDKIAKKTTRIILFFCIVLAAGYFFWWFSISPTYKVEQVGKFRRILPAFLMISIPVAHFVHHYFWIQKNTIINSILAWTMLSITLFIGYKNAPELYKVIIPNKNGAINKVSLAILNNLPDHARIYGMGYSQNPQVALLYKDHFYNFFSHPMDSIINYPESYILRDGFTRNTQTFNEILSLIRYDKIIEFDHTPEIKFELYKVNGLKQNVPNNSPETLQSCLVGNDFMNYSSFIGKIPMQNPSDKNKDWVWATSRLGLMMTEGNYNFIRIRLNTNRLHKYNNKDLKIDITYNDKKINTFNLWGNAHINQLIVPIPDSLQSISGNEEIFITSNTNLKYTRRYHPRRNFGLFMNEVCLLSLEDVPNSIYIDKIWLKQSDRVWMNLESDINEINLDDLELYVNGHQVKFIQADEKELLFVIPKSIKKENNFRFFFINAATNSYTRTYSVHYNKETNEINLLDSE